MNDHDLAGALCGALCNQASHNRNTGNYFLSLFAYSRPAVRSRIEFYTLWHSTVEYELAENLWSSSHLIKVKLASLMRLSSRLRSLNSPPTTPQLKTSGIVECCCCWLPSRKLE